MANIKLNLNEFNTYLQNNKIDFSAEQAKFDTIFKECNTITPDDGELKDDADMETTQNLPHSKL